MIYGSTHILQQNGDKFPTLCWLPLLRIYSFEFVLFMSTFHHQLVRFNAGFCLGVFLMLCACSIILLNLWGPQTHVVMTHSCSTRTKSLGITCLIALMLLFDYATRGNLFRVVGSKLNYVFLHSWSYFLNSYAKLGLLKLLPNTLGLLHFMYKALICSSSSKFLWNNCCCYYWKNTFY